MFSIIPETNIIFLALAVFNLSFLTQKSHFVYEISLDKKKCFILISINYKLNSAGAIFAQSDSSPEMSQPYSQDQSA